MGWKRGGKTYIKIQKMKVPFTLVPGTIIFQQRANLPRLSFVQEGISTIITAIRRSRMIFRRLETYIIYRMASSILILGFFFFAIIIMTFEMPTWVLVLINLFNDLSVMATSFDKVRNRSITVDLNMFLVEDLPR
jgi:hypothetical protein